MAGSPVSPVRGLNVWHSGRILCLVMRSVVYADGCCCRGPPRYVVVVSQFPPSRIPTACGAHSTFCGGAHLYPVLNPLSYCITPPAVHHTAALHAGITLRTSTP